MQVLLGGDRSAWEVRILGHILYPGGLGSRPDSARQAYTGRKSQGVRTAVELVNPSGRNMPAFHKPQQVFVLVDSPKSPHRPTETLTYGLQDAWGSAGELRRLGKRTRDGVLARQARLFTLSFCNIRPNRIDQPFFTRNDSRPLYPFVGAVLATVAVLKRKNAFAGCDMCAFGDCGLAIVRVHKLQIRPCE